MWLPSHSTHRIIIRHHPEIGHLFVPNLKARIPSERGGYFVQTNSLGFRSDIEFVKARNGRPRILFFGDSVTAGDGCDNQERFTELIGAALNAEVFNYGLSGSGTDQQLLIFERFAREVEADLIVVCVSVENIERVKVAYREVIDRGTKRHVLNPKPYFTLEGSKLRLNQVPVPLDRCSIENAVEGQYQAQIPRRLRWLYRFLDMYRRHPQMAAVRKVVQAHFPELRSQLLRRTHFQPYHDYRTAESRGWQTMQAILLHFFAQASRCPVLLITLPTYHFFFDGVKPIYQKLFKTLAAPDKGIYLADLTGALRQIPREDRRNLVFKFDKAHLSPYGHQVVAQLITEQISQMNLLSCHSGCLGTTS